MDGLLLRMNEYQQQMVDEMMDRSSLLQDLLEEEEARLQDLQQVHQGCLECATQAHGEIMQMLDALKVKLEGEGVIRDQLLALRAMNAGPEQDL